VPDQPPWAPGRRDVLLKLRFLLSPLTRPLLTNRSWRRWPVLASRDVDFAGDESGEMRGGEAALEQR